nr:allatostatin-A receptor-like [Lytechinus pictus]
MEEENYSNVTGLTDVPWPNLKLDSSDRDGDRFVIAWFQIISGCLGFVGNVTCLIVFTRISRKDHTNWLIISQCIADLITSFILVVATVDLTWFPTTSFSHLSLLKCELICRLWYSQVVCFTWFAISSFNLAVISLERYLAVIHPIVYLTSFKRRSACLLPICAWLMAPLMQAVLAVALYKYKDGQCVFFGQGSGFGIGVFVWEFLLPVSVMTYAFAKITMKLRIMGRVSAFWARDGPSLRVNPDQCGTFSVETQQHDCNFRTSPEESHLKELPPPPKPPGYVHRRKTTVTLFLVYLMYLVCWTPNQVAFLVFNFGAIPDYFESKWHAMSTILASFNICVNPIIYACRYSPFRKGFRQILHKFICSRL